MNWRHTCVMAAALGVSASACMKEGQVGTENAVVTQQQFLEGVPSDTPYIAASVQPAPLAQILPWLQTLDDAAVPSAERIDEMIADPETSPRKKRALALLEELTGHFTPEGLQELGFSPEPRFAVYGIGLLPAVRFEIEDATKVGALLERVEARAGVTRTTKTLGGQEYWTVPGLRHNRVIVGAFKGDQLLVGVTTPAAQETFVANLLGHTGPLESLDEDRLVDAAKKWELEQFAVGWIDVARVAQIIVEPKDDLNGEIWKTFKRSKKPITEACRTETLSIAAKVPRFVFGAKNWSPSSVSGGAAIEVNYEMLSALHAAKTGAPLVNTAVADNATGVAGFAFDLGTVMDTMRAGAKQIADNPFQCKWYKGINKGAKALSSRWTILPPNLADVNGASLVVRDISPKDPEGPKHDVNVDAVAAVASANPVELFDFVKSFNVDLTEVDVMPSAKSVALPPDARGLEKLETPMVFLQPEYIALTSGADWNEDVFADTGLQDAPFFFLNYDAERLAQRFGYDNHRPFLNALRGRTAVQLDPTPSGVSLSWQHDRETGD